MSDLLGALGEGLSDEFLFPLMQVALIVFVLFAVLRNWLISTRAGRGGASLVVTRGEASMSRFYATYAAASGLLIAIDLTVDVASTHRVLWVVLDTALVAYVCLLNPWFRNILLGWSERLKKIERR